MGGRDVYSDDDLVTFISVRDVGLAQRSYFVVRLPET